MNLEALLNRIENASDLDFGDILGKSFELFKKTWLHGFVAILFSLLLTLPAILVFYVPMVALMMTMDPAQYEYGAQPDPPIGALLGIYAGFICALVVVSVFTTALTGGFFRIIRKVDLGEEVTTRGHFKFFKVEYLKKTALLALMTFGISIVAALLCYFPLIYVLVPLNFVVIVFAFNEGLSPSDIIKLSFKLGNKKWLIAFGLMLVSGFMAEIAGLIMCGVGILFTMSFVYLPIYYIYKQVIGFEDEDEISKIGQIEE